ncbi:MAG: hypothetical protein ACRC5A_16355, partial [Enterobacteriaceae bacterium]
SQPAQQVMLRHYHRIADQKLMADSGKQFPSVKLFKVEELLGSWPQVMQTHFSQGGVLDQLLAEGRQ